MAGLVLGVMEILFSLAQIIRMNLRFDGKLSQLVSRKHGEITSHNDMQLRLTHAKFRKKGLHLGS